MLAPILAVLLIYVAGRGLLSALRCATRLAATLPRRNADFGLE